MMSCLGHCYFKSTVHFDPKQAYYFQISSKDT